MKILSNILVDLIKLNEDNKQSDIELKLFQTKLKSGVSDKMANFIKNRIKTLISENDLTEETEKMSFYYLVRKMVNSDFMDNLDIARIRYALEKEEKITEDKRQLFERIIKD